MARAYVLANRYIGPIRSVDTSKPKKIHIAILSVFIVMFIATLLDPTNFRNMYSMFDHT